MAKFEFKLPDIGEGVTEGARTTAALTASLPRRPPHPGAKPYPVADELLDRLGAHLFVGAVEHISKSVGIPAGLIALVLAPLATELPEKFNSVLWLRDNKDTLAIGNITGAMVFQSTIPVSVGVLFTPWRLDFISAVAAIFAILSSIVFLGFLLRKAPLKAFYMLGAGSLYIVFLVTTIIYLVGGSLGPNLTFVFPLSW